MKKLVSPFAALIFLGATSLATAASLAATATVAEAARTVRTRVVLRTKPVKVRVRLAPPAPRAVVVARPARPGAAWVWRSGEWLWRDGSWQWRRAGWARPPRAGVVWVPGAWRSGLWVAGYWR